MEIRNNEYTLKQTCHDDPTSEVFLFFCDDPTTTMFEVLHEIEDQGIDDCCYLWRQEANVEDFSDRNCGSKVSKLPGTKPDRDPCMQISPVP